MERQGKLARCKNFFKCAAWSILLLVAAQYYYYSFIIRVADGVPWMTSTLDDVDDVISPVPEVRSLSGEEAKAVEACAAKISQKQTLRGGVSAMMCEALLRGVASRPGKSAGGGGNLLIFGSGSHLSSWLDANQNGTTRFLQHHEEWVKSLPERLHNKATIHQCDTPLFDAEMLLSDVYNTWVPLEVKDISWDVILVHSTEGLTGQPGRMSSMYAAYRLMGKGTSVFVDGCERPVERWYAHHWIADTNGAKMELVGDGHRQGDLPTGNLACALQGFISSAPQ